MKKILKNKNIYVKNVNNHNTTNYHNLLLKNHRLSKGFNVDYSELKLIYESLENDFQMIDLIDLKNYERWLNV